MKRQVLALLAMTSIVGGGSIFSAPAQASATCYNGHYSYTQSDFQSWEHPFHCDNNLGNMAQWQADAVCNSLFAGYAGGELFKGHVVKTSHVWAHLNDRLCVYND